VPTPKEEKLCQTVKAVEAEPEPEPEPLPEPTVHEVTQLTVSAVLDAARVSAPDDKPFFWHRKEHRDELEEYLSKTGKSVYTLCQELRDAIANGRTLKRQPVRLSEIFELIGRARS
jgi:hypothetical protein